MPFHLWVCKGQHTLRHRYKPKEVTVEFNECKLIWLTHIFHLRHDLFGALGLPTLNKQSNSTHLIGMPAIPNSESHLLLAADT